MTRIISRSKKYSFCLFGEGKKDMKFLKSLIDLERFKYHTEKWSRDYDSAWGCSPRDILRQCRQKTRNSGFDLILCFIDLDKLKDDYKNTWEREKVKLEEEASGFGITIIWQLDKAEDEYKRVLGAESLRLNKHKLNKLAKEKIERFVNSDYWHKILGPIKEKEAELEKENNNST